MAHAFWDTMRRFDEEKSSLSTRNAVTSAAMLLSANEGRKSIDESWTLIRRVEEILSRDCFQPKRG